MWVWWIILLAVQSSGFRTSVSVQIHQTVRGSVLENRQQTTNRHFIASPDTEARCSCRSRRQRCRTGRGRTRSSSRGTLAIHLNDDGELKSGFVPLTWAGEEGGCGGEECRQEERGARHDQALCWQARTLLQRYHSVVTVATLFQI